MFFKDYDLASLWYRARSQSLRYLSFKVDEEGRKGVRILVIPHSTYLNDMSTSRDKIHKHSTSLHGHRSKSARELADAELQRAIQLSLQEVNGHSGHSRPGYVPSQPPPSQWGYSEPPIVDRSSRPFEPKATVADEEEDPDLKAAIEASLREANAPKPSAPIGLETPRTEDHPFSYAGPGYSQSYPPAATQPAPPKIPSYDLEPLEADAILTFNQTVEQVQAQGGRDLSRYPAVTELYDKASGLRPKLALSLDDAGRKEGEYFIVARVTM